MIKKPICLIDLAIVLIILLMAAYTGLAQSDAQIKLSLDKIVGYKSGFWSSQLEVQGVLRLIAEVPAEVKQVTFYLDGETNMGTISQPPFELQFSSDAYALGLHTITALGITGDGRQIGSNPVVVKFVSAGEGLVVGLKIGIPLLVLIVIVSLLSWNNTSSRNKKLVSLPPGTPRTYGSAGGAICGRCGRPFPLHNLTMNLGYYIKLERCPYCGNFRFVRRRTMSELRIAEAAELKMAELEIKPPSLNAKEKLQRELDASRYQND